MNLDQYLEKCVGYGEYRKRFEKIVEDIKNGLLKDDYSEYYKLNWQRSTRNEKTFRLTERLSEKLASLKGPVTWLVITEPWCGDSAQSMAAINAIAEASEGKISLKIFYRDSDTSLIDAFLTNGGRSIPKLVQMNQNNEVTGTWGPRPQAAQELVIRLKSDPATAGTYAEALHKWYSDDNTVSIQAEIEQLLDLT
jgi:thioredoxin-like negative regulator of GroEL